MSNRSEGVQVLIRPGILLNLRKPLKQGNLWFARSGGPAAFAG